MANIKVKENQKRITIFIIQINSKGVKKTFEIKNECKKIRESKVF